MKWHNNQIQAWKTAHKLHFVVLCAVFLRYGKGDDSMKNKGFLLLTEQERNAKFKAALHTKTRGGLTGDEIQEILHVLPADKQYEILVSM